MATMRGRGRAVGFLLLLQMAAGLILPFVLILPINVGSPDYLSAAANADGRVRASVLVAFIGAVLCIAIASVAFPVFRRYSESLAVAFLAACTASAALDAVHNSSVMAMLAMAKHATELPAGDTAHLSAAAAVYSARIAAHYTQLAGFAAWLLVFYTVMLRSRLIPLPLATLGLIAVSLQFTGVTLFYYLGYPIEGRLAMPLAPVHAATAIWLMVRGFPERGPEPNRDEVLS